MDYNVLIFLLFKNNWWRMRLFFTWKFLPQIFLRFYLRQNIRTQTWCNLVLCYFLTKIAFPPVFNKPVTILEWSLLLILLLILFSWAFKCFLRAENFSLQLAFYPPELSYMNHPVAHFYPVSQKFSKVLPLIQHQSHLYLFDIMSSLSFAVLIYISPFELL